MLFSECIVLLLYDIFHLEDGQILNLDNNPKIVF